MVPSRTNPVAHLIFATVAAATAFAQTPPASTQPAAAPMPGEERFLRNIRQITFDAMGIERAGEAYFSADAKRVCFQGYPKGKSEYQIYVMNVDGTGLEMVSTGEGATTCAFFHPDGTRMIFGANHHDQRPPIVPEEVKQKQSGGAASRYLWPFQPGMDIYEYTFATRQLKRLTDADGYDAEGSYSPDGKQIVFTSMRDGDQEIYIMNADGSSPRRITRTKGYDGGPFFSPDGKRIIYRSDRNGDGNMRIFVNNIDGTAETALTGDDVLNWCPYWHPSGKWLIFTRADHAAAPPNYDLYLLRDDGSEQVRVTTNPGFDGLPVFSRDGKSVMWTSRRQGIAGPQIYIADFIGLDAAGGLSRP